MKVIDLSHPIDANQPVYPGDPPVRIEPHSTIETDGYCVHRLSFGTHQGTHLDAPRHFLPEGKGVDQIPLDRLCGKATLVNLAARRPLKPNTLIMPGMLPKKLSGRVILRTGWEKKWGTPECFENYPGLTLETAEWLARKKITLLGMDTPGPSPQWLECHRILLSAGIILVENLCNLRQLPARFSLCAFPLNLGNLDGSPVRAAAFC